MALQTTERITLQCWCLPSRHGLVDIQAEAGSHSLPPPMHKDTGPSRPSAQAGCVDLTNDVMGSQSGQSDDARDMDMEPPEQSGYPTDPHDKGGIVIPDSNEEDGIRGGGCGISGGSGSSHTENDEPESSINMQRSSQLTLLAAMKKQSKVKEGDWSEVKQQYDGNDHEDGTVDIG